MPRPIIYVAYVSPPCRAVLLAAAALGVEVEVREIDLQKHEQLTPEFVKMNPEHTIPTLDEDGFYLWDSHAIMCYMADKYGKNDSLYPKDIRSRALVNQRLHFETGVLFARLGSINLLIKQTNTIPQEQKDLLMEAYGHLEKYLDGKKWLCGDSYTIADISVVATLSSIQYIFPISEYPNIVAWLKRCEENLPKYTELNVPGMKIFHNIATSMIAA